MCIIVYLILIVQRSMTLNKNVINKKNKKRGKTVMVVCSTDKVSKPKLVVSVCVVDGVDL